jgi:hypothetical protein
MYYFIHCLLFVVFGCRCSVTPSLDNLQDLHKQDFSGLGSKASVLDHVEPIVLLLHFTISCMH